MKINNMRKDLKTKKLCELLDGECFIYNNELYINLNCFNMGNICVYNLTHDIMRSLLPTTQITPIKAEINIIE